jgi:hypothetical protein
MFAIHIIQMQEPERLESKCGITVQLMESPKKFTSDICSSVSNPDIYRYRNTGIWDSKFLQLLLKLKGHCQV